MVENKTLGGRLPDSLKNKFREVDPKNYFEALNIVEEHAAENRIRIPDTVRINKCSDQSLRSSRVSRVGQHPMNYAIISQGSTPVVMNQVGSSMMTNQGPFRSSIVGLPPQNNNIVGSAPQHMKITSLSHQHVNRVDASSMSRMGSANNFHPPPTLQPHPVFNNNRPQILFHRNHSISYNHPEVQYQQIRHIPQPLSFNNHQPVIQSHIFTEATRKSILSNDPQYPAPMQQRVARIESMEYRSSVKSVESGPSPVKPTEVTSNVPGTFSFNATFQNSPQDLNGGYMSLAEDRQAK